MIGDSIKLMIPYNLILQLCVKNISGKHPIIPKDSNENYEQIKKLSISYTVCLGLQNNNIWEDIYLPHEDIPEYLVRNAIFDTFFYIQQWNPDYCMELTQNAFSMLFNQFSGKKYKLHDYMKVMQTILRFQKPLTCIGYDEIKRKTNLVDNSLLAIMENIAHKSSGININFNSILGKTNFYDKPLIEVSPQKYLLISPIICGFSFYQVLYRLCQSNDPQKKFDRLQGEEVEKFVLKCIKRKKFPYANGHYRYDFALNAENRECDLILEGSKRIVFVEIKKRPLPDNFQEIDFFDLTTCLAEGIVTAQLQAFRHKIQLKRKGVIDLYKDAARKHKEKTICLNNRVVNCVSLVSQEYGFLSYSMFGQKLLQVLTIGDFKSDDPDNMKRLTKINARAAQAQALYEMYANGRQLRLNEIYHDFTFRTCQQLMYAIDNSSTIEELIDNLINDTYVLNGTSDYYCQLFAHIDMKKKV